MNIKRKLLIIISAVIFISWLLLFNHIEPGEIGIGYNAINAQLFILTTGYHITNPWSLISIISIKPMRVSVQSGGKGYSAKLVQFNSKGWKDFVIREGFRYYWWSNRLSYNISHIEEHRGMEDILRGYAYSGKEYSFLTVISDLKEETK